MVISHISYLVNTAYMNISFVPRKNQLFIFTFINLTKHEMINESKLAIGMPYELYAAPYLLDMVDLV